MRTKTRGWLVMLACMGIAAAGCCKKKIEQSEDAPVAMASDDPGLEDPGESHRDSKVDRTIKCFNAAMRINKSATYYFMRLGGGKPRTGLTPSILFKPPASTNTVCEEAKNDQTPPMPEIDKIMPRYVELIGKLSEQLEQMDQYYRAKEYKTDKYKKGQALHEVFEKDYAQFKKLHDNLSGAIDAVADKRDDELIAKEAKVEGLRYFALVFLRDAKFLSREITRDEPDEDAFAELKAKVEASHKEFADHASEHPEQVSKAFMFNMYKSRADAFLGAVRDANPNNLKDRDIDKMRDKYNSMIDASNLVRWQP